MEKTKCAYCGRPGNHGAGWIISWGKTSQPVHRPCGEELKTFAPNGVEVSLKPSDELRQAWSREKAEKFWKQNNPLQLALAKAKAAA